MATRPLAIKRTLIGRPRATGEMHDTLLSKRLALPIFASDPLSSVAYATEAALVVLIGASATAGHYVLPVSIAISAVLAIVVVSYMQTVRAYETSGGAYVVARENLGKMPSLVAAAALLVDYILTVAVSVAAGVLALTSVAQSLAGHEVALSLGFIVLLTVVNLRGVRESGVLFALPTYGFVAVMFLLVGTGVGQCATGGCHQAHAPDPIAAGAGAIGLIVLLQAFASGASALTGVEAISNGVNAFRPPPGRNAARTLLAMGLIAITLFVGVSYLAVHMNAHPSQSVSVISEIARGVFPASSALSPLYYAVQALTFAILVLAANTSYQGFPRLAAVLARDRFFPRQFVNLGDRLVYSNGIIVLAAIASLLIWVFHANVISLIHLYVIGVFTAFTLSQAGMVRYWAAPERARLAPEHAAINGIGAFATGVVTLLVIQAKFIAGAWMVVIAVPTLIAFFLVVNRHYRIVNRRLRAGTAAVKAAPHATNAVVLYVDGLDPATKLGAWYAHEIAGTGYHPVWIQDGHRSEDPRGRLVGALRRRDADRAARGGRETRRRSARLRLVAAARRVELPDGRPARAFRAPVALLRDRTQADDVLPEAPPPLGARDRRDERPARLARRRASADPRGCARARLGGPRLVGPRGQLRPDARAPGHEGRLLRLRPGRGEASRA